MIKMDTKKMIAMVILILLVFGWFEFSKYSSDWDKTVEIAKMVQEEHPEYVIDFTKNDTYNVFMDLMMNSNINIIQLILPIIIIIPSIWSLHLLLKSGIFKDIIIRKEYKKFIKKEVLKTYMGSMIIPIFLLFMLILSHSFSGSFDINYTYNNILGDSMNFRVEYMSYPNLFLLIYIFNLWLICVFFINVSLLFINKNRNFFLTVLFSFLTIMAYQIISEVFIGSILANIFNNVLFRNLFSLYNLWVYDGTSLIGVTLYVVVLVIISSMLVYYNYKNKEMVVIENEK